MSFLDDLKKLAVLANPVGALANAPALIAGSDAAGGFTGGGGSGGGNSVMATRQIDPRSILNAQAQNAINQNNATVAQANNSIYPLQAADVYADAMNHGAMEQQQQGANNAIAGLQGYTALGFGNAAGANATGQNYLNGLAGYYGGLAASNNQGYQDYLTNIKPYETATPGITFDPIASSAADIARQTGAYDALMGIAGGSGDITAAQGVAAQGVAQQYYSNPADIARQQQAYDDLQGIANGSLDWQSQGAQAYADPRTVQGQWDVYGQLQAAANGSLDQESQAAKAGASAETIQKQQQGLDKLWGLTDPSITAQERLMMEIARREQETSERASRDAVMSDLNARGMGGSGAEISNMLGQQELFGQERTLADLGAQANAQQRATQSLAMYIDASGQLRSQEFDEAFSRAAAGDAMAVANANRRMQAMGMSADQINNMRQASFDEAYKRGLAADAASAANQQTRLQGSAYAADQANAIRQANDLVGTFNTDQMNQMTQFNVGQQNSMTQFNVGEQNRVGIANQQNRTQGAIGAANQSNAIRTSNDAILMHNSSGKLMADTQNMMHNEREAGRLSDLQQTKLNELQETNANNAFLASDLTGKGLEENDRAAVRNQAAINSGAVNALGEYGVVKDIANSYRWMGGDAMARAGQIAGVQGQNADRQLQSTLNNTSLAMQGPKMDLQSKYYDDAAKALQQDDDGLLGFGSLPIVGGLFK